MIILYYVIPNYVLCCTFTDPNKVSLDRDTNSFKQLMDLVFYCYLGSSIKYINNFKQTNDIFLIGMYKIKMLVISMNVANLTCYRIEWAVTPRAQSKKLI